MLQSRFGLESTRCYCLRSTPRTTRRVDSRTSRNGENHNRRRTHSAGGISSRYESFGHRTEQRGRGQHPGTIGGARVSVVARGKTKPSTASDGSIGSSRSHQAVDFEIQPGSVGTVVGRNRNCKRRTERTRIVFESNVVVVFVTQ